VNATAGPPRLDQWLAGERNVSRAAAQTLVDAGLVLVNGKPGRSGQRVRPTDQVEVLAAGPVQAAPPPPGAPDLTIVYEDEWLAVIDKPAGMVVHPAPGHPTGTLADGLRARGDTWSHEGGAERPGIVHRLDRWTSGLLVVARTDAAHRNLAAQLAARTLGRRYWAAVDGGVVEDTARIEAPVGRDPRNRLRMAVTDDGRAAITEFTVLERFGAHTVLDVKLLTGRTHQIRVHLAHIGRPIVGDPVYGRRRTPLIERPALHARELVLNHPADGTPRRFESPLPPDLVQLVERLRGWSPDD
jgi:23S rRNA pseudouridine1911/1915/1917 synthase